MFRIQYINNTTTPHDNIILIQLFPLEGQSVRINLFLPTVLVYVTDVESQEVSVCFNVYWVHTSIISAYISGLIGRNENKLALEKKINFANILIK